MTTSIPFASSQQSIMCSLEQMKGTISKHSRRQTLSALNVAACHAVIGIVSYNVDHEESNSIQSILKPTCTQYDS